jgi:hypothetical protein
MLLAGVIFPEGEGSIGVEHERACGYGLSRMGIWVCMANILQ